MLEPDMFRIICGALAAVLLGLIVMRRRGRADVD